MSPNPRASRSGRTQAALLAMVLAMALMACSATETAAPPSPPAEQPAPSTPAAADGSLRLDQQVSDCIRAQSEEQDIDHVRIPLDFRRSDPFTTETIIRCLPDHTKITLLLRDGAGTIPTFSEATWECVDTETNGLDLNASLRARHGLRTTEGVQHAVLARTAVLICVNDEEYRANSDRLEANNMERLAIRCMAQAAGGVRKLGHLSASTDPEETTQYLAHSEKCTKELQLSSQ